MYRGIITGFRRLVVQDSSRKSVTQNTRILSASGYDKDSVNVTKTDPIIVIIRPSSSSSSSSRTYASSGTTGGMQPNFLAYIEEEAEATQSTKIELDFENAENAFASKSKIELLRAILVLQICSYGVMVDNALKLMEIGHRILGKRLFTSMMKASFYGQFVAGETSEVGETISRFTSSGIGSMLHITAEDSTRYSDKEKWYERNVARLMECLDLQTKHCDKSRPAITHIKISSFCSTEILDKLNVILENTGRNFDNDTLVNYKNFANGLDGNLQFIPELTREENESLSTALQRLNRITQRTVDRNIVFMIDAEYYSNCSTMAMITFALMSKFNREKTMVWGTYQALLKETFDNVRKDGELARKADFGFGFKLVRGAYMQVEKVLALKHGYQVPINESYEETNASYAKCMEYSINRIRDNPGRKYITMFATHNEDSVMKAVALLKAAGIDKQSGQVFFGQLMGMCDHVSYSLGDAEYLVYKSVPYGPIEDVMPNMSRRAAENKTVFARLDKEKRLVAQAFRNRIL